MRAVNREQLWSDFGVVVVVRAGMRERVSKKIVSLPSFSDKVKKRYARV